MVRGERCCTCGRTRGVAQRRRSWSIHPDAFIPRTGNPDDRPAQIANDLICSVSVHRNGGTNEFSHLCDECLRIALRAIKVQVSEALAELDLDHDKDAEIADLTERLAHLQHRHHNVCFDHDRMQERIGALLPHASADADPEVVKLAEFEATRRKAAL